MLLQADSDGPGWSDGQIAAAFAIGASTLQRLREPWVEAGLDAALNRQPPTRTPPCKLDGAQEARLVAIACRQAPEGRAAWTLHRLADTLVALEMVDAISLETVRKTLKKTIANPG